jgi:hypothetical protein
MGGKAREKSHLEPSKRASLGLQRTLKAFADNGFQRLIDLYRSPVKKGFQDAVLRLTAMKIVPFEHQESLTFTYFYRIAASEKFS